MEESVIISLTLGQLARIGLAFIWGWLWAVILQRTRTGEFLVEKHTWIAVVIGVGVDLLLMLGAIPALDHLFVFFIITASSIGIVYRSLVNEQQERYRALGPFQAKWMFNDTASAAFAAAGMTERILNDPHMDEAERNRLLGLVHGRLISIRRDNDLAAEGRYDRNNIAPAISAGQVRARINQLRRRGTQPHARKK